MRNYNDESLLEMVELYAADNGLIDSEGEIHPEQYSEYCYVGKYS